MFKMVFFTEADRKEMANATANQAFVVWKGTGPPTALTMAAAAIAAVALADWAESEISVRIENPAEEVNPLYKTFLT